jgi:hypothetical protein
MPRTDYLRLIDRGRKAGLGTTDLYRALTARRPQIGDQPSQTDSNGFVSGYGANGQMFIRPLNSPPLA